MVTVSREMLVIAATILVAATVIIVLIVLVLEATHNSSSKDVAKVSGPQKSTTNKTVARGNKDERSLPTPSTTSYIEDEDSEVSDMAKEEGYEGNHLITEVENSL